KPTPSASGKPKPESQRSKTDNYNILALHKAADVPRIPTSTTIPRTNASPAQVPDSTKLSSSDKAPLPVFTPLSQEAQRQPVNSSKQNLSTEEFMQEVDPPELVELMDNEGNHGIHVWQPGGRSSGGTGAASELAKYLKELHKRIKAAWLPPRGQTRTTEILFRIRKTGDLVLVRVLHSSEDSQSDRQAIEAITASAPFSKLPPDCSLPYLDVKYTFNYSVDQLSEVHMQAVH
ncbi:MAG: TonB C-terminal domain-containing protein, partial [Candidatus Melainabacteria bacterium]|nr:TonB C-terminal domain-containing protein [Candidatus Melainabacteria bacterium]